MQANLTIQERLKDLRVERGLTLEQLAEQTGLSKLDALHLSDDAIEVLKTGKFNHRLLPEMLCHKDFQRMMLDAEIYVDRMADMRINDMNAILEAVRKMALMKQNGQDDLSTRTLELAQV